MTDLKIQTDRWLQKRLSRLQNRVGEIATEMYAIEDELARRRPPPEPGSFVDLFSKAHEKTFMEIYNDLLNLKKR